MNRLVIKSLYFSALLWNWKTLKSISQVRDREGYTMRTDKEINVPNNLCNAHAQCIYSGVTKVLCSPCNITFLYFLGLPYAVLYTPKKQVRGKTSLLSVRRWRWRNRGAEPFHEVPGKLWKTSYAMHKYRRMKFGKAVVTGRTRKGIHTQPACVIRSGLQGHAAVNS